MHMIEDKIYSRREQIDLNSSSFPRAFQATIKIEVVYKMK